MKSLQARPVATTSAKDDPKGRIIYNTASEDSRAIFQHITTCNRLSHFAKSNALCASEALIDGTTKPFAAQRHMDRTVLLLYGLSCS